MTNHSAFGFLPPKSTRARKQTTSAPHAVRCWACCVVSGANAPVPTSHAASSNAGFSKPAGTAFAGQA